MKISKKELNFLNQLTTEIIILDKEYKIIWLNDSALNKGWKIDPNKKEKNLISLQLSEETAASVIKLLNKSMDKGSSQTRRDFPLKTTKDKKREIDFTVRYSNSYECILIEVSCVDNLNKIIDSTKTLLNSKDCS